MVQEHHSLKLKLKLKLKLVAALGACVMLNGCPAPGAAPVSPQRFGFHPGIPEPTTRHDGSQHAPTPVHPTRRAKITCRPPRAHS